MILRPEKKIKHYVIKDMIGKGGMGEVWRAWSTDSNEYVAIKVVANDLMLDSDFRTRFLDEIRRHSSLDHPYIVNVLDVFQAEGNSYMVMDLVDGISLRQMLDHRKDHRMSTEEAIPIMHDILSALDYAHRRTIVHRDIKPSNVILTKDNHAQLLDFGIAIAVGEDRRTRTGVAVGTSLYMSPEQISRPGDIFHVSDVYSCGCMLYEMLTGRPPFFYGKEGVGDTDFDIQTAHVKKVPVNPKQRVPSIPEYIDKIIMRALEKEQAKRLPGCCEFAKLLEKPEILKEGLLTRLKGFIIRISQNT